MQRDVFTRYRSCPISKPTLFRAYQPSSTRGVQNKIVKKKNSENFAKQLRSQSLIAPGGKLRGISRSWNSIEFRCTERADPDKRIAQAARLISCIFSPLFLPATTGKQEEIGVDHKRRFRTYLPRILETQPLLTCSMRDMSQGLAPL